MTRISITINVTENGFLCSVIEHEDGSMTGLRSLPVPGSADDCLQLLGVILHEHKKKNNL